MTPQAVIDLLAGIERAEPGVTIAADSAAARQRPVQIWLVVWAAALAAVLVLFLLRDSLPWAVNYPAEAVVPVADWVSAIMNWLKINLSWLTRSITAILGVPLDFALDLLAKNFKIGARRRRRPPCPGCPGSASAPRPIWPAAPSAAGSSARWSAAVPLHRAVRQMDQRHADARADLYRRAVLHRHRPVPRHLGMAQAMGRKALVSPALDLMQTIPTFAYLIPMLLLFGNSPVSAMIATAIFATPPMVRATMLGLSRVPAEIGEFSEMAGCTARQKLWRVLLPSARPTLMVGVNQVIMLALNMVIIASMIGAGGLGYDVLLALAR